MKRLLCWLFKHDWAEWRPMSTGMAWHRCARCGMYESRRVVDLLSDSTEVLLALYNRMCER